MEMLAAMKIEMALKRNYGDIKHPIQSIYFGGGTPSILTNEELEELLNCIRENYCIDEKAEHTLEVNPDDITSEKLVKWRQLGFNRLSIGVQSFFDKDLKVMNRAHNALEAKDSIDMAQKAGFSNISIDLIYGIPNMTMDEWEQNVKTALTLNIQHVSAYALTVEPNTALHYDVAQKKTVMPEEEYVSDQFLFMIDLLKNGGFTQYEVSNFCKKEYPSMHNRSYWQSITYLGIGPSAHSYNGHSRQWNFPNNAKYIRAINAGEDFFNIETLDENTRFNEYIMLGLRTSWGINIKYILNEFDVDISNDNKEWINKYNKFFIPSSDNIILNSDGLLLADRIASDLMTV
ncbi:MAG: oxygen-independent coproporphyrinogen-3 oxidase [Patiriisocius sp.]